MAAFAEGDEPRRERRAARAWRTTPHIVSAARRCEKPDAAGSGEWRWRLVGGVDRLPVLEPPRDDEGRVEDRHREHEQRQEERRPVDAVFSRPCTETAASRNPSSERARVAHEDPRRDRSCGAGSRGTRRRRSPRGSPASSLLEREREHREGACRRSRTRPAARPSMPSRKLTMFITATIQSTVSGHADPAGSVDRADEREREVVDPDAEDGRDRRRRRSGPPSFATRREAAEVVDRADRRRDGGAEQDRRASSPAERRGRRAPARRCRGRSRGRRAAASGWRSSRRALRAGRRRRAAAAIPPTAGVSSDHDHERERSRRRRPRELSAAASSIDRMRYFVP